jgi:hypothetical protein
VIHWLLSLLFLAQGIPFPGFISGSTPPIAFVQKASASGTTNWTTVAADFTGANFLFGCQSGFAGLGTPSDSSSNTWTALTLRQTGNQLGKAYYVKNATVSASQTFTITGGSSGAFIVTGYSHVNATAPLDGSDVGTAGTGSTAQPGSVTPSNAKSLVSSCLSFQNNSVTVNSIDSGMTIRQTVPSGSSFGASVADIIETSIVAKNPIWTFSGSMQWAGDNAVFKQ